MKMIFSKIINRNKVTLLYIVTLSLFYFPSTYSSKSCSNDVADLPNTVSISSDTPSCSPFSIAIYVLTHESYSHCSASHFRRDLYASSTVSF